MFSSSLEKRKIISHLKPAQILAVGFALLILLGALVLMLPVSSSSREITPFVEAFFTSTSAVCVTGLVVYDTGSYWSLFGQIVLITLTQIGGLGFMTFAVLVTVALGRRVSLKDRLIMQEAYNTYNIQGVVRLMLYVVSITFTIEGIGAILLAIKFIPEFGWAKGIYYGIFHSISSFCNAGFDLMGGYRSITMYARDPLIVLTIGGLVMAGSLGFAVIAEIINHKKNERLTLNARIVIIAHLVLTLGGALIFFLLEFSNQGTIGDMSLGHKMMSSLFAAIVPRSVGFSSVVTGNMTTGAIFFTIILMFIGGAPGSTGGGIKTSTAAVLLFAVKAVIEGREDAEVFGKRLSKNLVNRAFAITAVSFALLTMVTMALMITESFTFTEILYETTSAFGTVGLSLGITPELSTIGKILISFTMYIGRLGPFTFALALAQKNMSTSGNTRYPEANILVG
ncbi:MAG: TrkH family potassium uptake protein [Clostridiaceae bacterium]